MVSAEREGAVYRQAVANLLSVVDVSSDGSFAWYGRTITAIAPHFADALSKDEAGSFFQAALSRHLYQRFYCTGRPVRQLRRSPPVKNDRGGGFLDTLTAANAGVGFHDRGWRLAPEAHAVAPAPFQWVEKAGLKILADSTEIAVDAELGDRGDGRAVTVLTPKEFLKLSPGYYLARGNAPFSGAGPLSRFYWNLEADGAEPFVKIVTSELNVLRVPFIAKVVADPRGFDRHDSAVLYVDSDDLDKVCRSLRFIAIELQGHSEPATPVFTLPLGPGFAFAEDPGSGQSFGMSRCRLIAHALIRAAEEGISDNGQRYELIAAVFAEHGIAIERPYLQGMHGIADLAPVRLLAASLSSERRRANAGQPERLSDDLLLAAATSIGHQIVADAIWYEGRCTWLGSEPDVAHLGTNETAAGADATYVALGSDLYHGASGTALFLAELFAASGEERFRDAAIGAIRHSLSGSHDTGASSAIGLYTGWPGLLATSAYVALLVNEEGLLNQVADIVGTVRIGGLSDAEFDLVSGSAGGIVAFLILDELLGGGGAEHAVRLGEHVLSGEGREGEVSSWKSPKFPDRVNLLGLSHGVAGIAHALIELSHRFNEPAAADAALRAFNYEDRYFSKAEQNWPDFRDRLGSKEWKKHGFLNFMTSWCHGAPGIALSRIHAHRRLNKGSCLADALIAVNTTARILQNSFEAGHGNFSLCHGWCGNADIVLQAVRSHIERELPDTTGDHYLDTVHTVARIGVRRYLDRSRSLPLGVSGGHSPALMLGLAGVGMFYLRVRSAEPADVLLPIPEQWRSRVAPRLGTG